MVFTPTHLPVDVLVLVFLMLDAGQLYSGDLMCVCKTWHMAMQVLRAHLRKHRWAYYACDLAPRVEQGFKNERFACMATSGSRVYKFVDNVVSWYEGKVRHAWFVPSSMLCPHAGTCNSFAVVGKLMLFRICDLLWVFQNGIPVQKLPDVTHAIKIIQHGQDAWVLSRRCVYRVTNARCVWKRKSSLHEGLYHDIAIVNDTIYVLTNRGGLVIKGNIVTRMDIPKRSDLQPLHITAHNNKLYAYGNAHIVVYDPEPTIVKHVREDIFSLAFVGETMCAAAPDTILVWDTDGPPTLIACPGVLSVLGVGKELHAMTVSGVSAVFTQ